MKNTICLLLFCFPTMILGQQAIIKQGKLPNKYPTISNYSTVLSNYLLSFSGKRSGSYNILSWEVDRKNKVMDFVIQKSQDGIYWTDIKILSAHKNVSFYQYEDYTPYPTITYYRLGMLNKNMTENHSKTITISNNKDWGKALISILYPNPTKNKISFKYTGNLIDLPLYIQIITPLGNVLKEQKIHPTRVNETLQIDTQNIGEGVYFMRITQGHLHLLRRFSKY